MKKIALLLGVLCSVQSFSFEVVVGLYEDIEVRKVQLAPKEGTYELRNQNQLVLTVSNDSSSKIIYLSYNSNQVSVNYNGRNLGLFRDLVFIPKQVNSVFKVKVDEDERQYSGRLDIRLLRGNIKLVNKVNIEEYVAGVVESEVGHSTYIEYLKSQSVLVRTYALRNLTKHANLGYQLCDTEHCQVYHSRSYSKHEYLVRKATYATQGEVVYGNDNRLIEAIFHSNCGGQTANSSDVWSGKELSYLKSSVESICTQSPHAKWYFKISKNDWFGYLSSRNPDFKGDYALYLKLNQFEQKKRKKDFSCGDVSIPLVDIREKFSLPSTFFNYKIIGDEVIIEGKGFGHGVGMCQEGAEARAKSGYSYREIIRHYYRGVRLGNSKQQ